MTKIWEKAKIIQLFNNWKNQSTKNECSINRCQDKTRIILTRMWRIWTQCQEHRNKKTFLIFESKNQITKIKKNDYISLLRIRELEKITSHTIKRSILLKRTKNRKKQNSNLRNIEIFCKKRSKNYQDCIREKVNCSSNAKKRLNFYLNENKVPCVAQKDFLVTKTKIQTKKLTKIGKKLPKSD